MELCIHNQRGFCKFGVKCTKKHENKVCENRNECTNNECRYRHPRLCKYFSRFGHCKFAEGCAYSHSIDNKSMKIEELEKEVTELKEDMKKLKIELTDKMEKEVGEVKHVSELNKDVNDLKNVVGEMKRLMAYMNRKINAIEPLPEGKTNEVKKSNERMKKKENCDETKKGDQKFKCEMCSYETKNKIALKKHVNTKHGSSNTKQSNEEGKAKARSSAIKEKETIDNVCETCETCEKCDFIKNGDKCDKCKKMMFSWAAEQCGVEWREDSD